MTKGKKTTIFKTLHRKLKIEQHEPHSKPVMNSVTPQEKAVLATHVVPVVNSVTPEEKAVLATHVVPVVLLFFLKLVV